MIVFLLDDCYFVLTLPSDLLDSSCGMIIIHEGSKTKLPYAPPGDGEKLAQHYELEQCHFWLTLTCLTLTCANSNLPNFQEWCLWFRFEKITFFN